MPMQRWSEMRLLPPSRMADLLRECPIVYVPSGILEWHDEHLPMGTDTLKMEEICRRTARLTGGLVHMPSYLAVEAINPAENPLGHGGIGYTPQLVKEYLLELFRQLELLGARLIVLSYGHTSPGNINIHEEAAFEYNMQAGQAGVLAMNDVAPAVKYRYKVADHAAKWETSFMMASYPEAVDLSRLAAEHGEFWGLDPRLHASAAEGERMYSLVAQETSELVKLARRAPREQYYNQAYTHAVGCWQDCQNMRDLADNYWQHDERWEDPFCWYCEWRSPGLLRELRARQGAAWLQNTITRWRQSASPYTVRAKYALEQIELEYAELDN
ncbi:MAG: creatininase family protein [Chloroflexi bacterium]|nr:creatininase family protein [Chloroflexota bacterium]